MKEHFEQFNLLCDVVVVVAVQSLYVFIVDRGDIEYCIYLSNHVSQFESFFAHVLFDILFYIILAEQIRIIFRVYVLKLQHDH